MPGVVTREFYQTAMLANAKRPKHELACGPPCCKCYYFLVVAPSHADRLSSPKYSALYRPLPEPASEPQRPFRHPSHPSQR